VTKFREDQLAKFGLSGWRMRVQQTLPLVVNMLILVTFSAVIRNTLHLPDVGVGSESFLWLERLKDPNINLAFLGASFAVLSGEVTSYTGRKVDEQRGKVEEGRIVKMEEMQRKEADFKENLRRKREEDRDRAEQERIQASKPRKVASPVRSRPGPSSTSTSAKRSLSTAHGSAPASAPAGELAGAERKRQTEAVGQMEDAEVISASRRKDYTLSTFIGGLQRISGLILACVGCFTPSVSIISPHNLQCD
jgi:hypothetical protein